MKFLTKINVSAEIAAQKRLFDVYKWHKALWDFFPDRAGDTRDFLFRIDNDGIDHQIFLLSDNKPTTPDWLKDRCMGIKTISESFLKHRYYLFDLRANPTKKIRKIDENGGFTENGKRISLTKLEDQVSWMKRKADVSGFAILDKPDLVIEPAQNYRFFKNNLQSDPGLHVGIRFKGILEVKNHDLFTIAFNKGIGSAKGFGFGMLLLKPIKL